MKLPFNADGWHAHCIWEHSAQVRELYRRRARGETEEMDCAAQAAEFLAAYAEHGDTLLDVGCGSGYFYHSIRSRNLPIEYYGIDAAPSLISIGQEELPRHGLAKDRLVSQRIEDTDGSVDHILCMNVLSNVDNFHRPLERLLKMARKSVILRESIRDGASYSYVRDDFLDPGVDLRVHVNAYDRAEVLDFIRTRGYEVEAHIDRHTSGQPQMVIGYQHYWTFMLAHRAPRI